MRKLLLLSTAVLFMVTSFASVTPSADLPKNASQVYLPIGKTGKSISLKDLSTISAAEYEKLSGKEMGFMKKLGFKMGQKKLKKNINADGTINAKMYGKMAKYYGGETGFHIGGFALGFFLGLIGVLLAYVVFDDEFKSNRVKWSWIGLGTFVVLYIIAVVLLFSSVDTTP